MKIGFTTDTNILKKKNEQLVKTESVLDSVDFYIDYINALKKTRIKKELIYILPETIIDELLSQKKALYSESFDSLIESYKRLQYGFEGSMPENNIDNLLKKEKSAYIDKINIIKLPLKKQVFQKLINDSIEKNAPFDKSSDGKKSDSGFKDALIWNTILFNECIDDFDYFYFFTGDKVFENNREYLIKEFSKKHINTKLIINYQDPDGQQKQNSLNIIINDHSLIKTDNVVLYDENLILNSLKTMHYDNRTVYSYFNKYELESILFDKFDCNDFDIDKVTNISDNKYKVEISINTMKYKLNNIEQNDNICDLNACIFLYFTKINEIFNLVNSEVINIGFNNCFFMSRLNGLSSAVDQIKKFQLNINQEVIDNLVNTKVSDALKNLAYTIKDYQTLNYFKANETKEESQLLNKN